MQCILKTTDGEVLQEPSFWSDSERWKAEAPIKQGINQNETVNVQDLISFCYRTIAEQLAVLTQDCSDGTGNAVRNALSAEANRLVNPSDLRRQKFSNTPF